MTDNEHAKADAAAKQRTDDQKKHAEDTRKKLKDEREAREKASQEHAKSVAGVKPTPTQEENDLAASGVHLEEHEPDGSTDPNAPQDKQAEAAKSRGSYRTKETTAL
jgi:hypothetical protein